MLFFIFQIFYSCPRFKPRATILRISHEMIALGMMVLRGNESAR